MHFYPRNVDVTFFEDTKRNKGTMTRRDLLPCVARDLPPVSHGENNNANDDDDDDEEKGAADHRMGACARAWSATGNFFRLTGFALLSVPSICLRTGASSQRHLTHALIRRAVTFAEAGVSWTDDALVVNSNAERGQRCCNDASGTPWTLDDHVLPRLDTTAAGPPFAPRRSREEDVSPEALRRDTNSADHKADDGGSSSSFVASANPPGILELPVGAAAVPGAHRMERVGPPPLPQTDVHARCWPLLLLFLWVACIGTKGRTARVDDGPSSNPDPHQPSSGMHYLYNTCYNLGTTTLTSIDLGVVASIRTAPADAPAHSSTCDNAPSRFTWRHRRPSGT
jgi:hypothetical protein